VFAAGNDPSGATATLIEEFNGAHPGVEVKFQVMPANTDTQHDAYVTYLSAGETGIDLYSLDVIWTAEFARAGWIQPLPDGFMSTEEFLQGPIESATYEGKLYAVPWFTDAGVLYYRKDLLSDAGLPVPETWNEFTRACRTVAAPQGIDGFLWQGARYEGLVCNFLEFFWGMGGSIDPERLAADPAEVEAEIASTLELMRGFFDDGVSPLSVLTYKEEDSRRLFTEGRALFLRNWPYAWSFAQDENSKVKDLVGIAPLPHAEGATSYSTIGGWNTALSSYSKHPKEALEFLEFITSERAMKLRAIEGGYMPTLRSTYTDDDVLKANPHFESFFEVFRNTRNRPRSPHYPRASDVIQENVHAALSGETATEDAAAAMVRDLSRIMAE
jgi:multiple sugar transport system substrate-binding protein